MPVLRSVNHIPYRTQSTKRRADVIAYDNTCSRFRQDRQHPSFSRNFAAAVLIQEKRQPRMDCLLRVEHRGFEPLTSTMRTLRADGVTVLAPMFCSLLGLQEASVARSPKSSGVT